MEQVGDFRWRWRGLACLELKVGGHTILIDPCFSRFPPWRMLWGRLDPTPGLTARPGDYDAILVTHAHWDHLLDVPQLACASSTAVYGSVGTGDLLHALSVPTGLIHTVAAGDKLELEGFQLEVLPAEHERVPGFGVGKLTPGLKPPLRARDYRLDNYLAYRITIGGVRLLTDPGLNPTFAQPADILFVQPQRGEGYYRELLRRVTPRLVVPIHWDSLFHAAAHPPRSYLRPRFRWPPLMGVSLPLFTNRIEEILPKTRVIVPEIGVWYGLTG